LKSFLQTCANRRFPLIPILPNGGSACNNPSSTVRTKPLRGGLSVACEVIG
jgi:hypothetical protein